MKTTMALLILALAISACISTAVSDTEDRSLKKTGRALETLGGLLQGKDITLDTPDQLADVISALELLHSSEELLGKDTSEYFIKKIRRVVENVAKAVVINKAVGAVAGTIG
uniref:Putative secreted protein n=1 Tax=Amblyomma cajennense TaxID=34607 RepID=A0A023FFA0_AMBCJ